MKEYMLLIRNTAGSTAALTPAQHKQFVKKCEDYIGILTKVGRLIAAQPLEREGKIISGRMGNWKETSLHTDKEMQIGYYHIRADNMEDAITIAKGNPEFEYSATASVEVRAVKMKEESTGFIYPKFPTREG